MNSSCFGCKSYSDKIGVLIAQLGTPEAPTKKALKPYLKEFLSDTRVIEANRALWWVILNGIILRTRPKRSAALYKRIWTDEGSPLMAITKSQTEKLKEKFSEISDMIEIEFGMRYGKPSLQSAIDKLIAKGCSKILLFPMYPQYAAATSASTYDVVFEHLLKRRWVPTLHVAEPYYVNSDYINALAATINESMAKLPFKPQRLVLSYHGIPKRYIDKGDPYCCMCTETTYALIPKLKIEKEKVIHTFQSRFGREPWLTPYTDETIVALGKEGIKDIAVACPGFTADCLETLDELGNEGKHLFLENGGKQYALIECLNDQPAWIESMKSIIQNDIATWIVNEKINRQSGCNTITCPITLASQKENSLQLGSAVSL